MQRQLRIFSSPLGVTCLSLRKKRGLVFIMANHWNKTIRVGLTKIPFLLLGQGQEIEIVSNTNTREELLDGFVALITSMAARIYGRQASKRRCEQIRRCVEDAYS